MYTINPKDPIIAIASAPGTGAIAVIRISGTGCIGIVSPLFKSLKKKSLSLSDVKSTFTPFWRHRRRRANSG
ncbi:MAG: hypothetical protein IPG90_15075 [Bacteroidetes bacterium]|nr:hypothetical protein [Bacteroidota bacterium]